MNDKPTIQDLIQCAKRELAIRKRVYPKWVERGNMSLTKMDSEIAMMGRIVEELEKLGNRQKELGL